MIRLEMLGLIVPRIVLEEFKNNKERVAQESSKSLSAHFCLVREAVNKVGGEKERLDSVLAYLDDVNHKIPLIGAEAVDTLDRIQQLMERSEIIGTTDR
jgi:ribosome assembly protein YihI (activator of Der GTPase)